MFDDWATEEHWLPVVSLPDYEVSDLGGVRNVVTGRYRTACLRGDTGKKYRCVDLGGESFKIAVLVLEAFVGPRPDGLWALHRDDDQFNDTLPNLYWGTPSANAYDREANRRRRSA